MARNWLPKIATATALALAVPLVPTGTAHAATDDLAYGRNDGGGFRNILPPGSNGVDTAADFQRYLADGSLPSHWADQQPWYENLLFAAPNLTNRQIPNFFKDATFGVRAGDRMPVQRPRPGVRIVRDRTWGVPRIFGKTRRDTVFGAGYAGAADRLFLMDVLRHTGRASLSSFLGGSNLAADADQWRFAAYSDADLRRQLRLAEQRPGGPRLVRELRAYVAGVNAYIREARIDPAKLPVEYGLIDQPLRNWRDTDVIATASLVGGIFGRGGGASVESGLVFRALQDRFGTARARQVWSGFRTKNDPAAPTTINRAFPYLTGDSFSRRGLAIPDADSVRPAPVISNETGATATAASTTASTDSPDSASFGTGLQDARNEAHMSNWELVAGRNSRTGRPLAVMGPQVGYWLPQILVEQELHGPGIDARGVAFAGVNLYVQMGHGRDYAWSATSAGSDNVDTFAEVLCGTSRTRYRYQGKCRPMEKLVRRNSWKPNVIDSTPAGSADLTAYRTVHGLVQSYGRVNGRRVAFVAARTTYMHEAESALGFSQLNNPNRVRDVRSFQKAADNISFTFNWAYADARDTGYFLSGAYPRRARGTSPDFPILGTGQYDWQGFRPRQWTADTLPADRHPQAVNPGVLVSWNNKPAPQWGAADDQWGYGPIYRSQMISDRIRRNIRGDSRLSRAQLVQAMALPATQDIRGVRLLPRLLSALGNPSDPALRDAVATLRSWRSAGSHRRDLNKDSRYEHNRAVEIIDAWWPRLVRAQFRPRLGTDAYESIQQIIGLGAVTGDRPRPPAFSDGWWGYVDQDLRQVFDAPRGSSPVLGREFCGNGDRGQCRTTLRRTLREALGVSAQQLYGFGACTSDPQAACYDRNRYRVTSAIGRPSSFPFQNRPTFQQVVSVQRRVAR